MAVWSGKWKYPAEAVVFSASRPLCRFAVDLAHFDRRQGDVLQGCHVRVKVELLEDETDLVPQLGHVGFRLVHAHAVHDEFALLDGLQAVDAAVEPPSGIGAG
jgi:hypothetical protein